MVQWCWVNFQCRGVLLIWIRVGQGPTALAMGAGGGCLDIFTLIYHFSFLSPSLWEMARYRLEYCLKGLLSQKQPTNQMCKSIQMMNLLVFSFLTCNSLSTDKHHPLSHVQATSFTINILKHPVNLVNLQ